MKAACLGLFAQIETDNTWDKLVAILRQASYEDCFVLPEWTNHARIPLEVAHSQRIRDNGE